MAALRLLRAFRAEARIGLRRGAAIVFVAVALLTGLFSAVMQDAASQQLQNARYQMRVKPWDDLACKGGIGECNAIRADERRQAESFLREQQRVGERVGALQTTTGAIRYASTFMGLGGGLIAVVLLATLIVAGEWNRGTIVHSFQSASPSAVALRKLAVVLGLSLIAFGFAVCGAWLAGRWGSSTRPLPISGEVGIGRPLAGMLVVVAAYSAIATLFAWRVREPLKTFVYATGLLGAFALTTTLGAASPGAVIASVLGIDMLLELEIGYLWIWPDLSFSSGAGSPVRIVSEPSWMLSFAAVSAFFLAAMHVLRRQASRLDAAQ